MEWVTLENSFFDQGPEYELEKGWMSVEDAKEECLSFGDQALGICVQSETNRANADIYHCVIAPMGTAKYCCPGGEFYCLVYRKSLPPDDGSLFQDEFSQGANAGYDGEWKRPGRGEGLGDEHKALSLFGPINPSDLHQGQIGDCWLISAFAAMAEYPESVKSLFTPKTLAQDGRYTIKLYSFEKGQFQNFEIDDRLPVRRSVAMYCAITDSGEIWPCLLEKAFAAYMGGYQDLNGGRSVFAFGAMTGCTDLLSIMKEEDFWHVCEDKPTTDKMQAGNGGQLKSDQKMNRDELLNKLVEFDKLNYVMCCGSNEGDDTEKNEFGIVQGHAYALLAVKPNCAGSGFNLMCLRNPWGADEWTGDWSDDSNLWDAHLEVAAECGFEKAEDGLFWITFEDFCDHYDAIFVVRASQNKNRGKKAIENTKALQAAPASNVKRMKKINPAINKKRAENMDRLAGWASVCECVLL